MPIKLNNKTCDIRGHKWSDIVWQGTGYTRTCRRCFSQENANYLIPDLDLKTENKKYDGRCKHIFVGTCEHCGLYKGELLNEKNTNNRNQRICR